nr:hypothetical protein [Tanacetum cinerariifolium]
PRSPGFAGGEWGRVVGSSRMWWNGQGKTWSGVAGSGGKRGNAQCFLTWEEDRDECLGYLQT